MPNIHSHFALLRRYLADASETDWALVTVVNKDGSSYRSPGAVMLANSLGQSFGLVSGGCLEADILHHAKQVFYKGQAAYVEYDMREEDTYAAELGIGCKGKVGILIQCLTAKHRELLDLLYKQLAAGNSGYLLQAFSAAEDNQLLNELVLFDGSGEPLCTTNKGLGLTDTALFDTTKRHSNLRHNGVDYSLARIDPPFNLWIFGGGADARPLSSMAAELGWRVTVVDHRSAYARPASFADAEQIIKQPPENATDSIDFTSIDAAVLMTHNLKYDAQWLALLKQHASTKYIGLLGPLSRRVTVEEMAEIDDRQWLDNHVNGPVGLDIGGELPESIALSILAQCHAVLHDTGASSLNGRAKIHHEKQANLSMVSDGTLKRA